MGFVIQGHNFMYMGSIETECQLWNGWMVTEEGRYPRLAHFLTYYGKPLCGMKLKGNRLYPEGWDATYNRRTSGPPRCKRCERSLKSRMRNAEVDALRILRDTGLHPQEMGRPELTDEGYLAIEVIVLAPVHGLTEKEAEK